MSEEKKPWFAKERSPDGKDEWLTPKYITDSLGHFDLDPCSPVNPPWKIADRTFNHVTDGLASDWGGPSTRVWMNPPYGNKTKVWMDKLSKHGNGIALIFARTETSTFFKYVWPCADSVFFFKGRLSFFHVDGTKGGTAGAPSCLVCYGRHNTESVLEAMGDGVLKGIWIDLEGTVIRTNIK